MMCNLKISPDAAVEMTRLVSEDHRASVIESHSIRPQENELDQPRVAIYPLALTASNLFAFGRVNTLCILPLY
jgi:hypothetical protein